MIQFISLNKIILEAVISNDFLRERKAYFILKKNFQVLINFTEISNLIQISFQSEKVFEIFFENILQKLAIQARNLKEIIF